MEDAAKTLVVINDQDAWFELVFAQLAWRRHRRLAF
jgi:hypothetical protein